MAEAHADAIEAAARKLYNLGAGSGHDWWPTAPEELKAGYRAQAAAVVTTVAPMLAAAARADRDAEVAELRAQSERFRGDALIFEQALHTTRASVRERLILVVGPGRGPGEEPVFAMASRVVREVAELRGRLSEVEGERDRTGEKRSLIADGLRATQEDHVRELTAAHEEGRQQGRAERSLWEHFAAMAFEYYDAPALSDRVGEAWHALKSAIEHWRALGGVEPRFEDEEATDGAV